MGDFVEYFAENKGMLCHASLLHSDGQLNIHSVIRVHISLP